MPDGNRQKPAGLLLRKHPVADACAHLGCAMGDQTHEEHQNQAGGRALGHARTSRRGQMLRSNSSREATAIGTLIRAPGAVALVGIGRHAGM